MTEWINVPASGRMVLIDVEDWDALRPLLASGVRLQSIQTSSGPRVVLREYATPRCLMLARVLAGPDVRFLNGNGLDHRRCNLGLHETAQSKREALGRLQAPETFPATPYA